MPCSSQKRDSGLPIGMVDPRAAKVDRRAGEVDGVQPPADAVAGLEHHVVDAGMPQPRCRRQASAIPAPMTTTRSTGPAILFIGPILRYAAGVGTQLPYGCWPVFGFASDDNEA